MPPWVFGDEIHHLDYVLKLSRGHLPDSREAIEPRVFELHRDRWDWRYGSKTPLPKVKNPSEFGIGAYSFQAKHPPLAHIIMSLFRLIFLPFRPSLLFQVKLLRCSSLLAVCGGLWLVYAGLKKIGNLDPVFYYPLLFIGLLPQDMFITINNDAYSFLFGGLFIWAAIRIFLRPESADRWGWLALGTCCLAWIKATNFMFFALWLVLTFFIWRAAKGARVIGRSIVFFLVSLILSLPWYIFNYVRYSYAFGYHYSGVAGVPSYPSNGFSPASLEFFFSAFTRTLFRGELVWNGLYFEPLTGRWNAILITILPLAVGLLGLAFLFKKAVETKERLAEFFAFCGLAIMAILIFGHAYIGKIPFYHARFVFGGLYFLFFLYAAGWKTLFRSKAPAFWIPAAWLFFFNVWYTILLVSRVVAQPVFTHLS